MDDRHWLLRALVWVYGVFRGFFAESFALAEDDEYESEDAPPTDEEWAITTMAWGDDEFL